MKLNDAPAWVIAVAIGLAGWWHGGQPARDRADRGFGPSESESTSINLEQASGVALMVLGAGWGVLLGI